METLFDNVPTTARERVAMITAGEAHEALFALGALGIAARRAATPEQRRKLQRCGVLVEPDSVLDVAYPVRTTLAGAIEEWSPPPCDAALRFFLEERTWATAHAEMLAGGPARGEAARRRHAALEALARRARREADLVATWMQLEPSWQRSQPRPGDTAAAVERVHAYLRCDRSRVRYTVFLDPLLPAFSGVGVTRGEDEAWILCGPTHDAHDAAVLLAHEIAHFPVRALWETSMPVKRALHRTHALFARVVDDLGYGIWPSFVMENLVRAISHRIVSGAAPPSALPLEAHFARALASYEVGAGSFEEAWVAALDDAARAL